MPGIVGTEGAAIALVELTSSWGWKTGPKGLTKYDVQGQRVTFSPYCGSDSMKEQACCFIIVESEI